MDQSNIYMGIQSIEQLIRQCVPIPQKICRLTKRLRSPDEVEKYIPCFMAFIGFTEQQIPRPQNKTKQEERCTILDRGEGIP
jgi:hypothetical protein